VNGPERVQTALIEAGLDICIAVLEDSTRTARLAAEALGAELGSIVKSLIFLADGQPVLVLVAGDRQADPAKLKMLLGARRVVIADAGRVEEATGFSIGGVPPVGHRRRLPAWVDASLGRFETVYAAAGNPHAIFPVAFETLVQLTNGHVADVTKIPSMEETKK
jgi:prolyl-tRNA editing enzyme YbaK/EbsC (Cys-tRNA(Pro) deacylase)